MLVRSLASVLILSLAACAPSADLRIPNAGGSIQPGRLVLVPVRGAGEPIRVEDELYDAAEFAGPAAHDAAFWAALAQDLKAELGWDEVRVGPTVRDTAFVDVRALVQGLDYGSDRWSVRTISVPARIDYDALGADHVLFMRQPSLETATVSAGGLGSGLERVVQAEVGVVWMTAGQDAPVLIETVKGEGAARGGFMQKKVNRDSWSDTLADLADAIAARVTAR